MPYCGALCLSLVVTRGCLLPVVTLTLDNANITAWAQVVSTALQGPLGIMVGIAVGGMLVMIVKRVF